MGAQRLAVVQHGDHWRIVDPRGPCGECLTYDEALAQAERLARRAHRQGRDVELLVHRDAELKAHLRLERPSGVV